MAYKVLYYSSSTPKIIHSPRTEVLNVSSGKVNTEGNKAGTFTFTLEPNHPLYDTIDKRRGIVDVLQNETIIFSGFIADVSFNFWGQKTFNCEGFYSQFNDSIQRPSTLTGNVETIIDSLLTEHNKIAINGEVAFLNKIKINKGRIDGAIALRSYTLETNMTPTIKCLQSIQKEFGGYMQVRRSASDGLLYLDYLTETTMTRNAQIVKVATNLIDLNKKTNYADIVSDIIPLGAKLASPTVKDERLNIKSVNGGLDYIATGVSISDYGAVYKPVIFEGITDAQELLTKAQAYVDETYAPKICIEAKAFDLSITSDEMANLNLLDMVRVLSSYHDIDEYYPITKMSINILDPSQNTITFGKETTKRISAQV